MFSVRKYRSLFAGLLFILSMLTGSISAQIPIKLRSIRQVLPDSVDVVEGKKRHFWRAGAEVVGFNLSLWAFDRYVQHGDFAYINFNTIKENFRHGFYWDNDKLGTNTFLHPYNGSLYFNAARSNGFNYWQSELFAIGGSAMWEMFMEREYPSTNDIIATPIGGAAIGEVLFRASDAVLDDRTSGSERIGREVAAFLISPMRGINRLITGQSWRRSATRGRIYGTPNFAVRLSTGVKLLDRLDNSTKIHVGGVVQLDMEYGDRYEIKSTMPYDYFTVRSELQFMKTQPILTQFQIKGRLLAREFLEKKDEHLSVGLYQHFDFYDSNSLSDYQEIPFKLGIPASLGVGALFRDTASRPWVIDAYTHFNGIILGSILSDHYTEDERNYNWASGFSIKCGLNVVFRKSRFSFSVTNELYRLFTWRGYRYGTDLSAVNFRTLNVQGDRSVASLNITQLRADVRLQKHLFAALDFTHFYRSTHYRDYPYVSSTSRTVSLMLSYKF